MNTSSERSPLLGQNLNVNSGGAESNEEGPQELEGNLSNGPAAGLDRVGLRCLLIQHLSSAWNDRSAEFALYLYLIVHFKDTLLPSSLLGFAMTATGVTMSGYAGSLIDKYRKLPIVRFLIASQKISSVIAYMCCAILLASPSESSSVFAFVTPTFICLLLSACLLHFSNIAISIAVERDWASCIAQASTLGTPITNDQQLAQLNTYLRQINLLCKLCAPLFVSMLTVKLDSSASFSSLRAGMGLESYKSIWVLSIVTGLSLVFEMYWIEVVYRRFPSLASDQARKDAERAATYRSNGDDTTDHIPSPSTASNSVGVSNRAQVFRTYVANLLNLHDWRELIRLPVFFSSASISLLYLTVLSFDGIMVGYLKTLSYSDDLIAEMRGICVITGLLGTVVAAPLEKKIGSVRAGNWSIWSMVIFLIPVIVSFYLFAPTNDFFESKSKLGLLGGILLFGGMALSRIGLWSFDLIQTKQLQNALLTHPRRNTLTGLQFTMQNVLNLLKYVLTMVLYRPSQFRWAATVSFASVLTGAVTYVVYVKKERGHVIHLDWVKKML